MCITIFFSFISKLIFTCWFLYIYRFINLIWFLETAPEEQPSSPVFVKELMASVALENSSHQLNCTVKGNPLPTVQWFKNDVNIDNSPDYVITYNNGEAVLKFEEVFLEDKATYTCKATNKLGQASTSAFLDVEREELYILSLKFVFEEKIVYPEARFTLLFYLQLQNSLRRNHILSHLFRMPWEEQVKGWNSNARQKGILCPL